MERLCSTNLYQRKNGKYNELYIMQLVQNYRSHPEILRIPNELFYENTLKACARDGKNSNDNDNIHASFNGLTFHYS